MMENISTRDDQEVEEDTEEVTASDGTSIGNSVDLPADINTSDSSCISSHFHTIHLLTLLILLIRIPSLSLTCQVIRRLLLPAVLVSGHIRRLSPSLFLFLPPLFLVS